MSTPVILAVDDEPEVLNAVERDLRLHYRPDYRIIKAPSGAQALDTTQQLKMRGSAVAMFLVDERMPQMTGTQFLLEALKLYPDARRVLLTAYADTETAITAINKVGLDHYLLKPWEPPSERLYPVLDDLLSEWSAKARPSFDGIRVAGTALSPASFLVKDFLSSNQIPYQYIDLENDAPTRELVTSLPDGMSRLPVVFLPDGSTLVQPTPRELAERIGLQTRAKQPFYDLVIVGGGPAGLAAAVYGASEGLRTVLVECTATGGQAGTSSRIENYLGFPNGLTGGDLARRATVQAKRFGAEILAAQEAVEVRRADPYRVVKLSDGTELCSFAVLLASGMEVRRLDISGIQPLLGVGVYYGAALTEASTYRNQDVYVVGAGNSAGQGAMFFSRYARKVTLLVRGSSLGASMSRYLVDRIAETENVQVLTNTGVEAVHGDGKLESITIQDLTTKLTRDVPAAALFIFIGTAPRTAIATGLLELDQQGFILTGRDLIVDGRPPKNWGLARDPFLFETSVPGIFAAGDARHGSGKRVASAVGEGSATVSMIHQYLETV
ncbi:MAG TPA: FAD-dependent oxidoreductase [Gemmatimonadaceae bacterium]|nr:FAD-dependent oxidoreductase [Gemmatimonadaceae bacterium]